MITVEQTEILKGIEAKLETSNDRVDKKKYTKQNKHKLRTTSINR